jgi:hypothetical protein
MKQTTIQFDKKSPEPVTIKRLQEALDLIAKTNKGTQSVQKLGLSTNFVGYLVKTKVISKISKGNYTVIEPIITRKIYYRVMHLQAKAHQKKWTKHKSVTGYNQLPKADTDMLGLVNMPYTEPIKLQRTPKPRVKKAVALPWWKRFLLYLLNN